MSVTMKIIYDSKIEEAMLNLQKPSIAKVLRAIQLLEEYGEKLRMPHSKKIHSRLFELRVRGKQEIRIFYTFQNNQSILLHLFKKHSQKTPINELRTAETKLHQLDDI